MSWSVCSFPSSRLWWLADWRGWNDCQPWLPQQLPWAQPLCLAPGGPAGPHHHCEWDTRTMNEFLSEIWITVSLRLNNLCFNSATYMSGQDPFICPCCLCVEPGIFTFMYTALKQFFFFFVQLTFSYFHVEEHSTCRWDSVTIFNGGSPGSPLIGQYCGENSPGTVRSGSNKLAMVFLADGVVSRGGFMATWSADSSGKTGFNWKLIGAFHRLECLCWLLPWSPLWTLLLSVGCGGIIHADTGTIKSPNYPQNFPANSECSWTVIAHEGNHLEMSFNSEFQIPDSTGQCQNSFIKVVNGEGTVQHLRTASLR